MIRAFISAFDPKATFYRSAVDGTLCVEYSVFKGRFQTATAHAYCRRILHFKRYGW